MSEQQRTQLVTALERHGERTTRQLMGVGVPQRAVWDARAAGLVEMRFGYPDARIRWALVA